LRVASGRIIPAIGGVGTGSFFHGRFLERLDTSFKVPDPGFEFLSGADKTAELEKGDPGELQGELISGFEFFQEPAGGSCDKRGMDPEARFPGSGRTAGRQLGRGDMRVIRPGLRAMAAAASRFFRFAFLHGV